METAQLVNLILDKLRTGRVDFLVIETMADISYVEFIHGGNHYDCRHQDETIGVSVWQILRDQGPLTATQYSEWIEGVLNGKTRNDAGVLS